MTKNLIKIFLVVFISTIIGYIVRWIIGKLDLEYNSLLMIIQATITLLLIISWVLRSERNKNREIPNNWMRFLHYASLQSKWQGGRSKNNYYNLQPETLIKILRIYGLDNTFRICRGKRGCHSRLLLRIPFKLIRCQFAVFLLYIVNLLFLCRPPKVCIAIILRVMVIFP